MTQQIMSIGESGVLAVPLSSLKIKKISKNTRFYFEEHEDGFFFRIIRKQADLQFPKLDRPLELSPDIRDLIEDQVVLSEEDLKDPLIKAMANEDFHSAEGQAWLRREDEKAYGTPVGS